MANNKFGLIGSFLANRDALTHMPYDKQNNECRAGAIKPNFFGWYVIHRVTPTKKWEYQSYSLVFPPGGGGGDRTRVRRRCQPGFYMLSLLFVSQQIRQTSTPDSAENPLFLRKLNGVAPRSCLF